MKKQISIVFNPHNMQENRKKTRGGHIEKNKAYYKQSRSVTQINALGNYPMTEDSDYKMDFLHDKECSCIETVNCENTNIVEQFCQPEGLENCQVCYREVILCNGITDINNAGKYINLFNRHKVSTELLYKFFVECKAKATIIGNYIEIFCHEDMWRISFNIKDNGVRLKHNNYVRNFFGERYFTQGYHNQNISNPTLVGALMYIMAYDYKKHHKSKQALVQNIEKTFLEEFEKVFEEQCF